jgi:hypothetical protein
MLGAAGLELKSCPSSSVISEGAFSAGSLSTGVVLTITILGLSFLKWIGQGIKWQSVTLKSAPASSLIPQVQWGLSTGTQADDFIGLFSLSTSNLICGLFFQHLNQP